MTPNIKAHLALLGTNLFFAINYTSVKYLTLHHIAGPLGINIIRLAGSLILFWLLFLFKPIKTRFEKKDWLTLILCAICAIALNQLSFIKGLSLTKTIHASLLTLIAPVLITIIAVRLLHEKFSVAKISGLALAIAGAALLIIAREPQAAGENMLLGDMLVIFSAVAYSFYFILVKPLMNKYSSIMVIRIIFTIGFFMTLPFCYQEVVAISWPSLIFKDYFLLFLLVVPGTFLAYIFNVYGIQVLNASIAGAYIYSQPLFAIMIAMIFLKEDLSFYKIISGILILAGVYLSTRKVASKKELVTY